MIMAKIVGTITTSHIPDIGGAIAKGLQNDPYWKPFFDGVPPVRDWLASVKPDVAVVVYNDHGLNFFLDKMPTFAIGAAPEYRNADEGWGIPVVPPFRGDTALSWHLIESLVAEEFDLVTCQEMTVDHAFTLPMALCWPDQKWPVRTVPVVVNTVQAPLPSAARCYKLGQALRRAITSWPGDERVVVLGTGGDEREELEISGAGRGEEGRLRRTVGGFSAEVALVGRRPGEWPCNPIILASWWMKRF